MGDRANVDFRDSKSTYFVQMFSTKRAKSVQRQVQLLQANPPQMFFMPPNTKLDFKHLIAKGNLKEALRASGASDHNKINIELFTRPEKSHMRIRLENLNDLFDEASLKYESVNIKVLAHNIYGMVNDGTDYTYIQVKELGLSANQTIDQLKKNKILWETAKLKTVSKEDDIAGT